MIPLKNGSISPQLLADLKAHAATLGTTAINNLRASYGLPPVGLDTLGVRPIPADRT